MKKCSVFIMNNNRKDYAYLFANKTHIIIHITLS